MGRSRFADRRICGEQSLSHRQWEQRGLQGQGLLPVRSTYKAQRQSLEILVHHVNKECSLTSMRGAHHTHTHTHTQIRTRVCTHAYARVHMHTCTHVCVYIHTCVRIYRRTHTPHSYIHRRLCLPCRMEHDQLFQSFSAQCLLISGLYFSPCLLGNSRPSEVTSV